MNQEEDNKIEFLENDYARQHYAQQVKKRQEVIFRRRRLALIFGVATLIFVSVGISLFNDYLRLQNLENYQSEAISEKNASTKEKAALEKEVSLLEDEDYVAKIARDRFLYSKEGELVFPLPEQEKNKE